MPTWQADIVKSWPGRPPIEVSLGGPTREFSITVLFGKSGEGKSTTLRSLAGLERIDDGQISFEDEIWSSPNIHLPPQQRGVGLLLQDRALFPHLTVAQNVAFGLQRLTSHERDRRVQTLLETWRISSLADRYPRQISGGEQQRTALARSLAVQPRILLLDEPLSSLDGPARERLGEELRNHLVGYSIPVLLVTHHRDEALALGDKICVMDDGKTVQTGNTLDVFNQPITPQVAEILGWTLFTATVATRQRHSLTLRLNSGLEIQAVGQFEPLPPNVNWAIRLDDIRLSRSPEPPHPDLNPLRAQVTALRGDERGLRVELDLLPGKGIVIPRGDPASNVRIGETLSLTFRKDALRVFP